MNVDLIGTENVLRYIEATGLTKFCIERANQNGNFLPVFECYESDTNQKAQNKFAQWSEFTNSSQPYKITLFNFIEFETLANGETKAKKSTHKGNKTSATFILSPAQQSTNTPQQTFSGDFTSLKNEIVNALKKEQEENAILTEIRALSTRLNALEMDEEDEEDEEEEESSSIAGIDSKQLQQIMGLVQLFKNNSGAPPVINGTETETETARAQKLANINNAIKRLNKTTPELDTHLLKLAEVSEQKPELYKMLLENLKSL